jgi:hypothetical protein
MAESSVDQTHCAVNPSPPLQINEDVLQSTTIAVAMKVTTFISDRSDMRRDSVFI